MRLTHRCIVASGLVLGASTPPLPASSAPPVPRAPSAPEAAPAGPNPAPLQASGSQPPLVSRLDGKAPQWLAELDVPSVAVAYVRDGDVAWTRVHGEQAEGVPATPRTLYNVASLAKPLFAETVLRPAAAGRLSLDEPSFQSAPNAADDVYMTIGDYGAFLAGS